MSGSAERRNQKPRGNVAQRQILIKPIARSPERAQKILCFSVDNDWVENRVSSGRTSYRFDSVAKHSEFPDHSCRMALLGLFGHCRAAFFIPNAVMQNYPDQVTEAMRNYADCFVMSQARH